MNYKSMSYKIKEIFYTLQGEGGQTGRAAVFCRFTGCNLWTGREKDREKAICQFCDTDFVGTNGLNGGRFKTASEVAAKVNEVWENGLGNGLKNVQNGSIIGKKIKKYVVCTGGEPALQLDKTLVDAFHDLDIEVAIETNGTIPLAEGIDWVCMSPKAGTDIVVLRGSELKLVFPQKGQNLNDLQIWHLIIFIFNRWIVLCKPFILKWHSIFVCRIRNGN